MIKKNINYNENDYFKNMFSKVDKNIILDNDQIKIIKDKSKNLIVIAGAGSGKTTTMSAKAKYLVDNKIYNNNEILIISYTNKAVNEISDYVNNKFNLNIDVMTFHKFSLNLLKNNNIKINIINDFKKKEIIKNIICEDNLYKIILNFINKIDSKGNIFEKNYNDIDKMTMFCIECIDFIKTKGLNPENIKKLYIDIQKSYKLKIVLNYILNIYIKFNDYCKLNYYYTFDDLIINSIKYIDKKYINYKYIIIDEYQDISKIRYNIVKKLSNFCSITVVGDDWQSIYSFSGSDIKYFLNFKNDMNATILKIENTYRNSLELINLAGKFIMKDNTLIKKNLISKKRLKNPIVYIYFKKNINIAFEKSIKKIIKEYGSDKKILILGRFNNDLDLIDSNKFIIKNNNITYILNRKIKIYFMTIHASKGLGFDNIILINVSNKEYGFPPKLENNFFKKMFFSDFESFNEERRLLYVALTRTKNKVYIICPFKKKDRSIFIKEIKE